MLKRPADAIVDGTPAACVSKIEKSNDDFTLFGAKFSRSQPAAFDLPTRKRTFAGWRTETLSTTDSGGRGALTGESGGGFTPRKPDKLWFRLGSWAQNRLVLGGGIGKTDERRFFFREF
jgi:hypothetical protein